VRYCILVAEIQQKEHKYTKTAVKVLKRCAVRVNIFIVVFYNIEVFTMSSLLNENYISIEDAAIFLNIKPVTLRKWIKEKNIPAHKIGKQWKFKRSELEEWVRSGKSAME